MRALLLALVLAFVVAPAAEAKPTKGKEPAAAAAKKKKPKDKGEDVDEAPPVEKTPPAPTPAEAKGDARVDEEGRSLQRGERVEFDARLIQGQTAKAGAVYLFARVPTNLKSMVRERTSFREKIIRTVFPGEEAAP